MVARFRTAPVNYLSRDCTEANPNVRFWPLAALRNPPYWSIFMTASGETGHSTRGIFLWLPKRPLFPKAVIQPTRSGGNCRAANGQKQQVQRLASTVDSITLLNMDCRLIRSRDSPRSISLDRSVISEMYRSSGSKQQKSASVRVGRRKSYLLCTAFYA